MSWHQHHPHRWWLGGRPVVGHESSPPSIFALQEGQYEREGYGQRPYDNWETIMFDCEKQVGWEGRLAAAVVCLAHPQEAVLAGSLQLFGKTHSRQHKAQQQQQEQQQLGRWPHSSTPPQDALFAEPMVACAVSPCDNFATMQLHLPVASFQAEITRSRHLVLTAWLLLLQEFKTVMSALKSNNERWGIMNVTLVLRRPSSTEAELCIKKAAQ
jgi:hypothetical protein